MANKIRELPVTRHAFTMQDGTFEGQPELMVGVPVSTYPPNGVGISVYENILVNTVYFLVINTQQYDILYIV